jgi:hypothetical protein
MTKEELDIVFHRANQPVENDNEKAGACDGIAFWKESKDVTLEQAAAFLRWQALQFNGEWNIEMLRDARACLRRRATLVRGGPGWVVVWDGLPQETK